MLAHSGGQVAWAAMALAFAGAVLGFLRFNTYPASVFMGDAGSQLLGFAVGVLSLCATQIGDSAVSAATPILLLALPILDTLSVMVQRISEGRSPFDADKNHIHHKLLKLGFDHHEAVMVIYAIQADLFLMAYWLRYESDLMILTAVTIFFVVSISILQSATRRGWHFRQGNALRKDSPVTRFVSFMRKPQYLPRWSYIAVAASVGLYACLIMAETVSVSSDVQILVVALLAVTAILLAILRVKPLNIVEKAALYVTTAVIVYLDSVVLPAHRMFSALSWAAIGVAAAGTVLRLRLSPDRRFVLTPLDLIVLFVALVVPSLPDSFALPDGGARGIAKLVILFYALEVLLSRVDLGVVWLRVATASILLGLMLRPLLPL
jgi:UDP-GlcNAc:undecaprenyl-phosphate GlcNAc-1-phosphate transferase